MQTSTLSSRIRESAVGLAKDLFPNSINGYGALETTNELATLRSAHKLSSAPSHGTSSSPQLSQALNQRHYSGSGSLQHPNFYSGLDTASDADEELTDFLLQECNMRESDASSSRSGSILDLTLANGDDTERESRDYLRRNDSFEPELSRSEQKSPAHPWHVETVSSQQGYYDHGPALDSSSREVTHECFVPTTEKDRHQELSLGYHTKTIAENNAQMPAATQTTSAAELRQTDSLESSYNQFCGGEDAQEWAEFEASLFRTYSGQSQATGLDLEQTQQHGQSTIVITEQQAPLQVNLHKRHMLQDLKPSREDSMQQDQTQKKDEEQSKRKEPVVEFHCPWIDCHSVRMLAIEAVRDCLLTKFTEIPGMYRLHPRYREPRLSPMCTYRL
jgi:hypothetical protein